MPCNRSLGTSMADLIAKQSSFQQPGEPYLRRTPLLIVGAKANPALADRLDPPTRCERVVTSSLPREGATRGIPFALRETRSAGLLPETDDRRAKVGCEPQWPVEVQ